MKALWSAAAWWPLLLGGFAVLFLLREIWALASGRPQDTLSDWVWRVLRITASESPAQWSATDYLVFCLWLTLVSWLTFHFFLRRFA